MKTSGAFVICQNDEDKILLVKRRDFPLWDLPGGRVERAKKLSKLPFVNVLKKQGLELKSMTYQEFISIPNLMTVSIFFLEA